MKRAIAILLLAAVAALAQTVNASGVYPGVGGATGANGSAGAAGADGKTVRSGSGVPGAGLGVNGDFYIDTAAWTIYGPKATGAWGSSTSIVGPQGTQGIQGTQGTTGSAGAAGADGKTVRSGSGVPDVSLGVNGDFYIDTSANAIYGPKAGGAWGSSTSIVGPTGSAGSNASATPMLLYGVTGQGSGGSLASGVTHYACFGWGTGVTCPAGDTAEGDNQVIMTRSGTLKNLYVALTGSQPASGSLVYTVRKNAVDTAIVATLAAAANPPATNSDTTHTVSVVAGDLISLKIKNNATSSSSTLVSWSLELD